MSPEEKRARRREQARARYARDPEKFRKLSRENRLKPGEAERRRERDRAAYARDPEKFRKLAHENRLKPGAAERHKEDAKAWALRNAERVKALRKAWYEKNRREHDNEKFKFDFAKVEVKGREIKGDSISDYKIDKFEAI